MAISLTGGELYVIGETDPRTGAEAPFVKIGIVRENENRTTDHRVKDHQTGNPRLLQVRGVVKSPMVERLETALHDRFAPFRISGEWFHMEADQVAEVLAVATQMAKHAKKCSPFVADSAEFRASESDGRVLDADKAAKRVYTTCVEANAVLKACGEMAKKAQAALIAARASKIDVSAFLRPIERAGSFSIDQEALELAHPKIFKRFQVTKQQLSQRFTLASAKGIQIDIGALQPELAECVGQLESRVDIASRKGKGFDKVHESYLAMVSLQAPIEWEGELAEEELRARCGTAAAIDGICKWQRTLTQRTTLDTAGFKKEHPDLAVTFGVQKPNSTAFVIAKDRNFRL